MKWIHIIAGLLALASGAVALYAPKGSTLHRKSGHAKLAERISHDLIGRNVVPGHWTFQLVEEFDDGYYADFRTIERDARDELAGGRRHLYEAELKERRRTHGRPVHEAR